MTNFNFYIVVAAAIFCLVALVSLFVQFTWHTLGMAIMAAFIVKLAAEDIRKENLLQRIKEN